MSTDLLAALCLVAVIEGLFLFVSPRAWKRMVEQLYHLPERHMRITGAVIVAAGLLSLWAVRAG
ncbi:DUF2065 domain-containing protein [Cognatilysobacter tabacisoli]|jgi:uncharacterized protein YjeT (DUF2065 family)|uniref:DUF2065 domain-containing protein n=1 Tax=Cognatilysobacter tabacisoli TaxID=2315424 RepID=UPI000E6B1257|nr:DUF2065 domain-containing protein [Lysobacter tabacisoli]